MRRLDTGGPRLRLERRADRAYLVVGDVALPVRQGLELLEGPGQSAASQLEPELAGLRGEPRRAGELAEHDLGARRVADASRIDVLVVLAVLEDTVLVDARRMAKGVAPHDGLVGGDADPAAGLDELGQRIDAGGVDVDVNVQAGAVDGDGHDDLFERGVARALADAVDAQLDLPRPGAHRRDRVGRRHAQIVLPVKREHGALDLGDDLTQVAKEVRDVVRQGVADGVGDIDGARAGAESRAYEPGEERPVGARRVHR